MKGTRTTEELDSLLGRGSMGAARRDGVIAALMAGAERERRAQSRRRWSLAGLATLAAAAAGVMLLVPASSRPPSGAFRGKGGAGASSKPSVAIECLGAGLEACPAGSRLVVGGSGVRGFVSAWAEPTGGGERIWYFSADSVSPQIDSGSDAAALVTRAVKIGPEHASGSYRVELRVTERPMSRSELLHMPANAALATGQAVLTVTPP